MTVAALLVGGAAVEFLATITDITGANHATAATISPTTFFGVTLLPFQSGTYSGSFDFGVSMDANVAQNYFTSLLVQQTDGSWRSYQSSAATFSHPPGDTTWLWGTGSNRVWTSATTLGQQFRVRLIK